MSFIRAISVMAVAISSFSPALALPTLDETKSLTVNGQSIEVVLDDIDKNRFYFFPSTITIETKNNTPQFSFYHYGITKADPQAGTGANVNITFKPDWDHDMIDGALAELKKTNPDASVSIIPIEKSYFDVVISSDFVSAKTSPPKPPILLDDFTIKYLTTLKDMGITAELPADVAAQRNIVESIPGGPGIGDQVAAIDLSALGARLSVDTPKATEDINNFMGIRYRYMVKGVTPKFRAELTVHWRKTYTHFQHSGGGSFWFVHASHVIDVQSMKQDGSIELKITDGAVSENSETMINTIFETICNARINGTGMFSPQLKPAAMGGDGGGGSSFGWSFNANTAFQSLDESVDQKFIIDKRTYQERAYDVGAGLGLACTAHKGTFKNLTDPAKPCITGADIDKLITRVKACWKNNKADIDEANTQPEPVRSARLAQITKECS